MKILSCVLLAFFQSGTVSAHEAMADSTNVPHTLDEIVVTGTRTPADLSAVPSTVSVLTRDELTAKHRTSLMPTLMEEVPGLMVTSRGMMGYGVSTGGSGGMMLRGISSGSGQVMVLIDGHPQYSGIYGHTIADSYQTIMAENVEVVRGPASMLYGSNAMGGVVNIITHKAGGDGSKTSATFGAGSYGTLQAEASNQTKMGKFCSTVAANYGRSDNQRPNMGFYQYDGYIDLGYELSTHWQLFANFNVTHFGASYPGTISTPMLEADQWITRGSANVGTDYRYNSFLGRISIYDNFGRHKINDGYEKNGGTPQSRLFRSRDALGGVSWYQTTQTWHGANLTTGFDYQHIYGRAYYTNRTTGEILETKNKQSGRVHNNEWAGYAELNQVVLPWLTLDAGIRYDHHSLVGGEWIPQGGIAIRPVANGVLKLSVAKGFRNPTMRELYLYPSSNTDLQAERLVNYEISWRQRIHDGRLAYGANLFYIDAQNIIQTINRQNVNTGKLNNFGVEADLKWHANSHWSISTNHAYLHMKHPVTSAPTYKGYLASTYNINRWTVRLGLTQVIDLYTAVGETPTKDSFTLLDASVSYHPMHQVELWVRGDNLLAQHYEFIEGQPMPRATFMAGVSVNF